MAKTTAATARAKAEARPNTATTKQIEKQFDAGMEQVTDMASKFTGMAEGGVKALTDSAVASTEVLREIGNRNVSFVTQAMEQSVELTQTLANVRDPREMFELQSAFAKSMFSAYTTEMTKQTELCVAHGAMLQNRIWLPSQSNLGVGQAVSAAPGSRVRT
jgi:phasin